MPGLSVLPDLAFRPGLAFRSGLVFRPGLAFHPGLAFRPALPRVGERRLLRGAERAEVLLLAAAVADLCLEAAPVPPHAPVAHVVGRPLERDPLLRRGRVDRDALVEVRLSASRFSGRACAKQQRGRGGGLTLVAPMRMPTPKPWIISSAAMPMTCSPTTRSAAPSHTILTYDLGLSAGGICHGE